MDFNKTDEQLKQMTDDELFEYLDAKAAHLAKHISPLSSYYTKKFASIGAAISETEFDYDSVKKDCKRERTKRIRKIYKRQK